MSSSREAPSGQLQCELFEPLGSGGMATVHLGRLRGPWGISRTVAIKRLHEHLAVDQKFVDMFIEEARLASRVRHPNVVSVLDVIHQDGELMLVMEYVHGVALHQLVSSLRTQGERLSPAEISAIMTAALQGLHAAHEARGDEGQPLKLVHRDISPHNLLVGDDGVCRVTDFGIATGEQSPRYTGDGNVRGKIHYMAPEQILGEPLDRRADIFAAGVVLWELATGRRMHASLSLDEVLHTVLEGGLEPPSTYVPCPAPLEELIMSALAREPAARPPTALDMARRLEAAVPPATALQLADLVAHAVGPDLGRRSLDHQAIEGGDATLVVSVATESHESLVDLTSQPLWDEAPAERPFVTAEVTSLPTSPPADLPPHPTPPKARWPRVLAGIALLAGAASLLLALRPAAPRVAERGMLALPLPIVTVRAPSPVATAPAPSATPAPAPTTVSRPHPRTPTPTTAPAPRPPAPAAPRPRPRCSPPYWIDAQGEQHFKPECF